MKVLFLRHFTPQRLAPLAWAGSLFPRPVRPTTAFAVSGHSAHQRRRRSQDIVIQHSRPWLSPSLDHSPSATHTLPESLCKFLTRAHRKKRSLSQFILTSSLSLSHLTTSSIEVHYLL